MPLTKQSPSKSKQSYVTGWLTTKKRGRDDDQISRDVKKAMAERKKRRAATVTDKRKQAQKARAKVVYAKKKAWQAKTKKNCKHSYDDEGESEEEDFVEVDSDGDSLNDFVVEDDADILEEEASSSEDELEVVLKPKLKETQRKQTPGVESASTTQARTLTPQASSDSSIINVDGPGGGVADESDSDSDSGAHGGTKSFFGKFKARPSKPSKALKHGSIAATNHTAKAVPRAKSQRTRMSTPPFLKAKGAKVPFESYTEDLTSPEINSPGAKKSRSRIKLTGGGDSDGDSSDIKATPKCLNQRDAAKTEERSADASTSNGVLQPSQANLSTMPNGAVKNQRTSRALLDSSDEDDDYDKVSFRKAKIKSNARTFIDNGDEEDDDDDFQEAIRRSINDNCGGSDGAIAVDNDLDDDDDEEEKAAIKLAVKESKKEAKREAKKNKKSSVIDESENGLDDEKVAIFDETSEEEDDVEDEYEEEKRAAFSVLETAEHLSAEVVRAMMDWQNDGNHLGPDALQGMIMDDGAMSMFALKQQTSDHRDQQNEKGGHSWITKEEMSEICPKVTLSDYQLIGVNWLALLHSMKCSIEGKRTANVCGVLADQMGLGKTVQTITFLAWLKHRDSTIKLGDDVAVVGEHHKPHLIVVPVSVIDNWMREFDTFCPSLKVVKYHGSQSERKNIQVDLQQYLTPGRSRRPLDIILCPVVFFQKEKSSDRSFLSKFKYEYLVVDEAHMLKNAQSIRYKMLNKVSSNRRLLLTGTPVQNSPQELLNMLCFLMPLFSRGGTKSFDDDGRASGIKRMLQHFVDQKKEEADDEYAYKKLKQLFAPFVLRRKKDDVLAHIVPPKQRVVEFVQLDPKARNVYDAILAAHMDKSGTKVSAAIGDSLFTNLRKAAHHALLLRTRHTSPEEVENMITHFYQYGAFKGEGSTRERVAEELRRFNDFEIHLTALELIEENSKRRKDLERYILNEDDLFCSAKFKRLREIIPPLVKDGHRILIFSAWTSCLDLLGCLMQYLGLEYLRMDGSCPGNERQDLIDKFNRTGSISIFLLSTKACGIGINLTSADVCILHDLDINPFNDLQAEDRCHRIGQKRPVTVVKMVAKDTVDNDIYDMQERKSKMNAAIMDSKTERNMKRDVLNTAISRFKSNTSPGKKDSDNATCVI